MGCGVSSEHNGNLLPPLQRVATSHSAVPSPDNSKLPRTSVTSIASEVNHNCTPPLVAFRNPNEVSFESPQVDPAQGSYIPDIFLSSPSPTRNLLERLQPATLPVVSGTQVPYELNLSHVNHSATQSAGLPTPVTPEISFRRKRTSSVRMSDFTFPTQRPDDFDVASEIRSLSPKPLRESLDNFVDNFDEVEQEGGQFEFVSLLPPNQANVDECLNCGAQLVPTAKFCHECGCSLAGMRRSSQPEELLCSFTSSKCDSPAHTTHRVYHRQVKIARGGNAVLGRGAKGWTFKALDVVSGKPLAVKEMAIDFTDANEVNTIRNELRHLSTVRHPHIVEYLGCMVEGGRRVRILMERLECGTLADLLKQFPGGIPEDVVSTFTAQLLSAVAYCHGLGMTHRDIKPSNILHSATGTIKLADFGCALVESTTVADGHVEGTPAYLPPEVLDKTKCRDNALVYGIAHDLWSIGCTVHELLTSRTPWDHTGLAPLQLVMKMKSLGPFPIDESISPDARDFIGQCLQLNMTLRPRADILMQHPFACNGPSTMF